MADKWLISDTHFNDADILTFKDKDGNLIRPFDSVEDMNEHIIDRWNSVVHPDDKVYHLGDFAMGTKDWVNENFNRLNGQKTLIVGNGDDIKFLSKKFSKVYYWRSFNGTELLLSHTPMHASTLGLDRGIKIFNVHGHIHQNPSPEGPYMNVSVEAIDFTPINIDIVFEARRQYYGL